MSETKQPTWITGWNCEISTTYDVVVSALRRAGLDEKLAREMLKRHAFARACQHLKRESLIEQLSDEGGLIRFQFNKKIMTDGRADYPFETILVLNKETGVVSPEPVEDATGMLSVPVGGKELAARAQDRLDKALGVRTTRDISRLIDRIAQRNKLHIFPIAPRKATYVVLNDAGLLDQIDAFVNALPGSGRVIRYRIMPGDKASEASVSKAVSVGLAELIESHREAIDEFAGRKTRRKTIEECAERVRDTRFQIDLYRQYLADSATGLDDEVKQLERLLDERLEEMSATKEVAPAA